jgi:protein gp37
MAENTEIEWADHTFNPWEGCQKVGPGCDHCYAETRNKRFAAPKGQPRVAVNWGPGAPRRRTSRTNWNKPRRWAREAKAFYAKHGRRQRVFCASLADVFDNAVDPQWRADLFRLIMDTPELDWLLLTKRIGNVEKMVLELGMLALAPNVWLGSTVVTQEEADRDVPKLLETAEKLGVDIAFLSMEPLLGPVIIPPALLELLRWVIVGGESGDGARAMQAEWVRSLRDQCEAARVPFLFKQWGEWLPLGQTMPLPTTPPSASEATKTSKFDPATRCARVGKHAAGRALDGRTYDGFPIARAA